MSLNFGKSKAALFAGCMVLWASAANAQDSAQVNANAELVTAPQTFSIAGAQPIDFGQIALPEWTGVNTICRYDVDTVQADGSSTAWSVAFNTGIGYDAGQVTPQGCFIAGNHQAARFDFSCTDQNVTFTFSTTDVAARPEWESTLIAWPFVAGDPFYPYHIVKDGLSVTTSADVLANDGPWGVDCAVQGAGDYLLYAGAAVYITVIADTSSATLGIVDLGTLTVNAAY